MMFYKKRAQQDLVKKEAFVYEDRGRTFQAGPKLRKNSGNE